MFAHCFFRNCRNHLKRFQSIFLKWFHMISTIFFRLLEPMHATLDDILHNQLESRLDRWTYYISVAKLIIINPLRGGGAEATRPHEERRRFAALAAMRRGWRQEQGSGSAGRYLKSRARLAALRIDERTYRDFIIFADYFCWFFVFFVLNRRISCCTVCTGGSLLSECRLEEESRM